MSKKIFILIIFLITISWATVKIVNLNYDDDYQEVNTDENEYFWKQFHEGNIENIDNIISKLENKYKKDSTNLITNSHLGFAHIWALSEYKRIPNVGANVTDHAYLSYKHFSKAYELNPNDKRVLGFLADAQMAYGSIINSSKMQRKGYFKGLKSISEWPEFNKFTIGVTFSNSRPTSKIFKKSLEWQWTTLEDCYTNEIDRTNPDIKEFIKKDISGHNPGKDRACYNNWIAPHNIEGYFLHMGDMIIKTGDFKTAIKIYELAKSSPNYESWVFKDLLEKRILNAESNTKLFLERTQKNEIDSMIITNSGSLCISCHKMSEKDNELYKNYDWKKFFKSENIYSINKKEK